MEESLTRAMAYWVCTVDPQGRQHAAPVDGNWLDGALYFSGAATTRRHRNLLANPAACIHLESASDVIILHGSARPLLSPHNALVQRLIRLALEKYGYAAPPEVYSSGGVFVFTPSRYLPGAASPRTPPAGHLPTEIDSESFTPPRPGGR